MKSGLLLDSNILIDYLRGDSKVVEYLEALAEPLFISSMTVAELYAGVRNKRERHDLDQFIEAFLVLPVDKLISQRGGDYRRKYGRSHNLDLIDALIAATVATYEMSLITLNKKHFPMLKRVIVPY